MTDEMFEFLLFRRAISKTTPNNGEHQKMIEHIQEFLKPHDFELVGRKISILPGQGVKPSLVASLREWFMHETLKDKPSTEERLQEAARP